jgi:glucosamine--fructose-6-phosphate aminotransferase (isomerizing)
VNTRPAPGGIRDGASPHIHASAFEADIAGQPAALRALANSDTLRGFPPLDIRNFDRVVLTGMGASHYSALPAWRRLTAMGIPAWRLSTSEILDSPGLLTAGTLLWITSQSGRSGEVVALLERLGNGLPRPRLIVGITNDAESPLAAASDALVALHSGVESTVSTKTYLNSLAAHHLLLTRISAGRMQPAVDTILAAADELETLAMIPDRVKAIAAGVMTSDSPRIALIGAADHAASALVGALVIKEAAKLAAEGFTGGEFRHGPLELAGPGLTAVLFTASDDGASLRQLSADLQQTGSFTIEVGPGPGAAREHILTRASSGLSQLMADAKFTQSLSVELARARALVPGEFRYGRKVTSLS